MMVMYHIQNHHESQTKTLSPLKRKMNSQLIVRIIHCEDLFLNTGIIITPYEFMAIMS